MYPYPSGVLHIGHWYAFAVPDAFARLQRMRGYNVLFPMGFDAFGLPAENAAIRHNIHPAIWTFENIDAHAPAISPDGRHDRLEPGDRHLHSRLLPLEPVALPADAGARSGLPRKRRGLVVPERPDSARQRAGPGRQRLRALRRRGLSSATWSSGTSASPTTPTSCCTTLDALDWPERVKTMQRNWIGRSEGARLRFMTGDGRCARGLHHPARHRLGRDLHGAGA